MFDFQKAINGEPIYCNGLRIYPNWLPSFQQWEWNKTYYNKDKTPFTTDPPKKKVMVTAYVYLSLYNNSVFCRDAKMVKDDMFVFITEKQFEVEI